jgi:hypothetical protein
VTLLIILTVGLSLLRLSGGKTPTMENRLWLSNKQYSILHVVTSLKLIPVAARSQTWVCGRSLAGIVGSNPAGGMDVCLLWVLWFVMQRSLRGAEHSSRGVLPSVVCMSVIVNPRWGGPGPLGIVAPWRARRQAADVFSWSSRLLPWDKLAYYVHFMAKFSILII